MNLENPKENSLLLSKLKKTWFIDIDGTLLVHNSDLETKDDEIILSSLEFIKTIKDDVIILTTSRSEKFKEKTETFLSLHNIRYDQIIYNLPYGERILVNDNKQSGLKTAYSISLKRNAGINLRVILTEI